MAQFTDHVEQAKHNKETAAYILLRPEYRDWAITAAFYSAVHLVEACFSTRPNIGHTEVAYKRLKDKNKSPHEFRSSKLMELAPEAFKKYKVLRTASQQLRYLEFTDGRQALFDQYYPRETAEYLVNETLPQLKKELELVFARYL